MNKVLAESLKIGDVILPPAREIQLWMRRHLQERGLPESAMHLTITEIHEGNADKRGRWLVVTADHAAEWFVSSNPYPFKFKVRPESPWPRVS